MTMSSCLDRLMSSRLRKRRVSDERGDAEQDSKVGEGKGEGGGGSSMVIEGG